MVASRTESAYLLFANDTKRMSAVPLMYPSVLSTRRRPSRSPLLFAARQVSICAARLGARARRRRRRRRRTGGLRCVGRLGRAGAVRARRNRPLARHDRYQSRSVARRSMVAPSSHLLFELGTHCSRQHNYPRALSRAQICSGLRS